MKKYLNAKELADSIGYSERYIRSEFKRRYLYEGIHYMRVAGGRKLLFDAEAISELIKHPLKKKEFSIPMANGGLCHG
jgi:hypothetical protein